MRAITSLVVRLSRSRRAVVLVAVAFAASLTLLLIAGEAFHAVSGGADPFDLQDDLTADEVSAQLAAYEGGATGRYLVFTVIDWIFPLLGGLLLAVITAACLRNSLPRLYERAEAWGLFALFFVPTVLDWTENVFALWIVVSGAPAADGLVTVMLLVKKLKLTALDLAQLAAILSLVVWVVAVIRRRRAMRSEASRPAA